MRRLALILYFSASLLCAQVIHVSVNLVQVDAVVTDSKGHHVSDLQPVDFEILEDGKPQKITNFSWIEVPPPTQVTRNPRKEDVRRSIVVLIDDGSIDTQGMEAVTKAARGFVTNQMAPGDLVAITSTRGGMGFYQQFTSDKPQLYAAIDQLSRRWAGIGIPFAVDTPAWTGLGTLHRDERPAANPVGFLRWAIQGLQNTPGRKALVLFAHAFPAPPDLIDMANRAGVVIYVIDPEGVDYNDPIVPGNAPYRALAKQTGGLWIRSVPGAAELDQDIGKALADMSGYYLLGYQPVRSDFELKRGAPVHHNIVVKVRRPELAVRARNGFMGVPDAAPEKAAPHTTDEYLQQALFSPFEAGNIRLRMDSMFAASPPDPKTKLRQALLRTMLVADGRDLQFTDTADGKKKLVYSVLLAVFGQDGSAQANSEKTFTITATPGQAEQMKASGLHAVMNVKLEKAGAYQVRAAVRDERSGETGSAYSSYLEVPDFNKPQLALSSIELSAVAKDNGAVWSEFAAGSKIHFECEVFGVQAGRPPGDPKVEMEIRLFRNGDPVFDSKPLAASTENLAEHFLTGNVQLGSDMEPGDYTMQLVAYDRLAAPKKQVASQWTDLTVVKR